ncbi:MAG: hypothetical protein NTX91_04400 [candidate division SR1 bacterium]|nr:hypothetical protein [candidate division SR1 bacterium]
MKTRFFLLVIIAVSFCACSNPNIKKDLALRENLDTIACDQSVYLDVYSYKYLYDKLQDKANDSVTFGYRFYINRVQNNDHKFLLTNSNMPYALYVVIKGIQSAPAGSTETMSATKMCM